MGSQCVQPQHTWVAQILGYTFRTHHKSMHMNMNTKHKYVIFLLVDKFYGSFAWSLCVCVVIIKIL